METEHEFVLILAGSHEFTDELADRIFLAGCDDATVSSSRGKVRLIFSRWATSRANAMLSARLDVELAGFRVEEFQ